MSHVAVVLSGCGYLDGTEVREACYTLLALDQHDATFDCFAPDKPQMHVVDHLTGKVTEGQTRNVLVESARIARGAVAPLSSFDAARYDALLFPGGFGGAKNLSDFALKGAEASVDPDVYGAVHAMQTAGKPLGFICITPASVGALCLGSEGPRLTIGDDKDTAAAITTLGGTHVECPTAEAVVDEEHRIVSTPAYMDDDARPSHVFDGIDRLVGAVLRMARQKTVQA